MSGLGNHATQSVAGQKPTTGTTTINALNTLYFTYTNNNNMTLPNLMSGAIAGSAFYVAQLDASTGQGPPIGIFGTGGNNYFPFGSNIYDDFGSNTRFGPSSAVASLSANPFQFSVITAANDWRMYMNATQILSSGTNTVAWATGPIIAAVPAWGRYLGGRIAEIFVYKAALSTTDRQSAEAYLKAKWATP